MLLLLLSLLLLLYYYYYYFYHYSCCYYYYSYGHFYHYIFKADFLKKSEDTLFFLERGKMEIKLHSFFYVIMIAFLFIKSFSFCLFVYILIYKKPYDPFFGRGSTVSRLQNHYKEKEFLPQVYRISFDLSPKDKRLCRPWSQPLVLNLEPLDRESSALTTSSLLGTKIL